MKLEKVESSPGNILVDAVEAGLWLVFAVAGQVEGEDAQSSGRVCSGSRDLDVLQEENEKCSISLKRLRANRQSIINQIFGVLGFFFPSSVKM